jgi:formylglycine-generating enzyme required for sulfatase activity
MLKKAIPLDYTKCTVISANGLTIWYGEYNIDEKMNPKGPETGERKVDRGGGFYDAACRCRSACRGGGTPPGNRGTGIGFRLVKDKV